MTASTTEQERAEFEKAWRERPIYMGGVHQKEVAYIWWMQAARRAPAVPVPQFNHSAKRKLNYLLEAGETITGYAFQNKDGRRGSIDCHGFVAWWHDAAAPQPPEAALVRKPLTVRQYKDLHHALFMELGRKPLTDEMALCRAIERAHDIQEQST